MWRLSSSQLYATVPDRYAPPAMADVFASIHGAKVFSKLDILKGNFQVPVHPDDVEKTDIITLSGPICFIFLLLAFEIVARFFQRLTDSFFGELPFCVVYVDGILLFRRIFSFSASRPTSKTL